MTEPDVTLTDYGLAIECGLFLYLLHRRGQRAKPVGAALLLFFGSVGVATLAGGTVHGFFLDGDTVGHLVLWRIALIAIGATALSAWTIGAGLLFSAPMARRIIHVARAGYAGYLVLALFVTQDFLLAVLFHFPAALFLLGVLAVTYARTRERWSLITAFGVSLTFVASAVQQGGIALHPSYFNHNALYHLIQAVALWLLYLGFRSIAPRASGRNVPA